METLELWPSLIGIHQYSGATNINPLFQRVFMAMRATDPEYSESDIFYASRDDLLHRVKLNEWNQFLEFAAGAVRDTAKKPTTGFGRKSPWIYKFRSMAFGFRFRITVPITTFTPTVIVHGQRSMSLMSIPIKIV